MSQINTLKESYDKTTLKPSTWLATSLERVPMNYKKTNTS